MNSNELKLFKTPDWFDKINSKTSILPLASWDSSIRHFLVPLDERGAILCWTFSNPASPVVSQLFIKLTESEAQKVSMTDLGSVGMLESVRMNLEETEAIMVTYMKRNESQTLVMPFHIKRDHSEEHLSRGLDATASFALDNLIRKPVLKIKTENDTFKRSKS